MYYLFVGKPIRNQKKKTLDVQANNVNLESHGSKSPDRVIDQEPEKKPKVEVKRKEKKEAPQKKEVKIKECGLCPGQKFAGKVSDKSGSKKPNFKAWPNPGILQIIALKVTFLNANYKFCLIRVKLDFTCRSTEPTCWLHILS